jgi:hypothetical protein
LDAKSASIDSSYDTSSSGAARRYQVVGDEQRVLVKLNDVLEQIMKQIGGPAA